MVLLVNGGTRTVARLAGEYAGRLGCLLSPDAGNSIATLNATGLPIAADNGAFSGFDAGRFRRMIQRKVRVAKRLLWVACPDAVADAVATLERFREWGPQLAGLPLAFVAQDGAESVTLPWDSFTCLFLGGSTAWKLGRAAASLACEAKDRGKLVHAGRVNSRRRLDWAIAIGADSCDGTSMSRWGDRRLTEFVRHIGQQGRLFA